MSSSPRRSARLAHAQIRSSPDKSSQLPSPPSSQEDPLLNNKRKRNVTSTPNPKLRVSNSNSNSTSTTVTTPNPKPRKQSKLVRSPPPQLDSPTKQHAPRTPATRYESPKERFTPPREITLSPPKRSASRPQTSRAKLVVQVKHEKPDIDLSLPLPPPSPTEDPILLHGKPRRIIHDVDSGTTTVIDPDPAPELIPQPVFTRPDSFATRPNQNNSLDSSPSTNASTSQSHPSSSPNRPAIPTYFNFTSPPEHGPEDSDMSDADADADEQGPMPVFNLAQPISAHDDSADWSSSDDDEGVEEGEGDYTGSFHTFTLPIKADPPTSATKARMEEWDAKVRRSPHPKAVVQYSSSSPARPEHSRSISATEISQPQLPSLSEDEDDRLPPSDDIQDLHHPVDDHRSESGSVLEYADDPPEPKTPEPSSAVAAESERTQLPSPPSSPLPPPFEPTAFTTAFTSTPHADGLAPIAPPQFDFSTIETPGAILSASVASHDWAADQEEDEDEDDQPEEEDPIAYDHSLIQITSSDPYAAARATAILKAHDYECFTRASLKRRSSLPRDNLSQLNKSLRRRDLSLGGIRKSMSPYKSPRKAMYVRGDSVYFEQSPMRTLPDLLVDAEEEVSVERSVLQPEVDVVRAPITEDERDEEEVNLFCTPPPQRVRRYSKILDKRRPGGEWSKEDWKALDSCFTDERLALAASASGDNDGDEEIEELILADVEEVDFNAVVKRFAQLYEYDVDGYVEGPWSRKGLLKRANALRNKQRSGKGAPPTHRSSSAFSFRMDSPSFDVPDFTPTRRSGNSSRSFVLGFPQPSNDKNPFASTTSTSMVPKSLLAPRYSHLLEEARSVSFSLPAPTPSTLTVPKEEPSEVGLGKKVSGLVYSYLKAASSSGQDKDTSMSAGMKQTSLPPPPPQTGPRGPINTPARPTPDRYVLPHVDLNHTSPPRDGARPITKEKPRRMIDLNHIPTPKKVPVGVPVPMKRLERKGSVKDLVKSFEERSLSGNFEDEQSEMGRVLRELREEKAKKDREADKGRHKKTKSGGLPAWKP